MQVSAWRNGKNTYGISVGLPSRDRYFSREWTKIEIELDGRFYTFKLMPSFWRKCAEFRDSGEPIIGAWLNRHRSLDWSRGKPPKMELLPLGNGRFRLLP